MAWGVGVRGPTGHFDNFLAFLCVIVFGHINSKHFIDCINQKKVKNTRLDAKRTP